MQNAEHIAELQRIRDLRAIGLGQFRELENQRQSELQKFYIQQEQQLLSQNIKQEEQVLPRTKNKHPSPQYKPRNIKSTQGR